MKDLTEIFQKKVRFGVTVCQIWRVEMKKTVNSAKNAETQHLQRSTTC